MAVQHWNGGAHGVLAGNDKGKRDYVSAKGGWELGGGRGGKKRTMQHDQDAM